MINYPKKPNPSLLVLIGIPTGILFSIFSFLQIGFNFEDFKNNLSNRYLVTDPLFDPKWAWAWENSSEALVFYNQAIELETDSYEKAKILFRIATNFRKNGLYSRARSYYMQALGFNPSMGRSYLAIAQMYASSAKNCGADNFSQRAVYWLASKEAMKASRVDGTLKSAALKSSRNYEAKAPQKSEIFSSGREGEVIEISCWIGRSVKVPNL